jgi:hypothetical protein
MLDMQQEMAMYLAVRNGKRAMRDAAGPLPAEAELVEERQPRWARLRAYVSSAWARRPKSPSRRLAGEMRAEGR